VLPCPEHLQDGNRVQFTASDTLSQALSTIAAPSKPSSRKPFVDKEFGLSNRDRKQHTLQQIKVEPRSAEELMGAA